MTAFAQKSILMVAGEVSGDIHAAAVIRELKRRSQRIRIFGLGGPRMAEAGMELREDLASQGIMGLAEVVRHLPKSLERLRRCEKWIREEKPDLLFTVDYQDFNLRLARRAKKYGVPVCHYVAPSAWAWRKGRVALLRESVDQLLVILPFEKKFFEKEGVRASYVGNPLMEEMDLKPVRREKVLKKYGIAPGAFPLVCAMPGSRKNEIQKIWPLFLSASRLLQKGYPDAAFGVPVPAGFDHSLYPGILPEDSFFFMEGPAYDLRKICDVAWVKSGTGTLETALLDTPMVMVYKMASLSAFLAKRWVRLPYFSLVNLLAGKAVIPELIQEKADALSLLRETSRILEDPRVRRSQQKAFSGIRKKLSSPRKTSRNVASEIIRILNKKA